MECAPTRRSQKRFSAIHLLLLGVSINIVLQHSCVCARTLRLWIDLFNNNSIDGLKARAIPGRPRKLSKQQFETKIVPLLQCPDTAGYHHWTVVKLHGYLIKNQTIDLSYSSLLRHMHENNYKRLFPRPMPEPRDKEQWRTQRSDFTEKLKGLIEDKNARIFFCDETGIEGDPRPRQTWATRGSCPKIGYHGGHLRRNVVGAVEPSSGHLTSLIVSHCNTEVFQAFLDLLAKEQPHLEGEKIYLIMDNATWHKAKILNWHHIIPTYLPPYSPDFNPIERLWLFLKQQYLAGFITNDGEALTNQIVRAICQMLQNPKTTKSVCSSNKFAIKGNSF